MHIIVEITPAEIIGEDRWERIGEFSNTDIARDFVASPPMEIPDYTVVQCLDEARTTIFEGFFKDNQFVQNEIVYFWQTYADADALFNVASDHIDRILLLKLFAKSLLQVTSNPYYDMGYEQTIVEQWIYLGDVPKNIEACCVNFEERLDRSNIQNDEDRKFWDIGHALLSVMIAMQPKCELTELKHGFTCMRIQGLADEFRRRLPLRDLLVAICSR